MRRIKRNLITKISNIEQNELHPCTKRQGIRSFRPINKKAYFFLLDGIFAVVILVIGFMMISSNRVFVYDEVPLALVAENTMDLLSTVKINDLCDNACECSHELIETYCKSGRILNKEQSLIDYFGELYDTGKVTEADTLFSVLLDDLIRTDLFNAELVIDGNTIYTDNGKISSPNLISSKKIGFGFYENRETGVVSYWGPYIIEVNIWQ